MEIRTADSPPLTRGALTFIFAIVLGFISIGAFVVCSNKLYAVGISAIGLCIWLFLLRRQGKIERFLKSQHSNFVQAENGFCCQDCKVEIGNPITHQNKQDQPILYHCKTCNILWFTGSVDHSTS